MLDLVEEGHPALEVWRRELRISNFPHKIASAFIELILAAFRTETADLERLAEEVDASGQDSGKIRAAIKRYASRRTQTMETIHNMLQADAAEWRHDSSTGSSER